MKRPSFREVVFWAGLDWIPPPYLARRATQQGVFTIFQPNVLFSESTLRSGAVQPNPDPRPNPAVRSGPPRRFETAHGKKSTPRTTYYPSSAASDTAPPSLPPSNSVSLMIYCARHPHPPNKRGRWIKSNPTGLKPIEDRIGSDPT